MRGSSGTVGGLPGGRDRRHDLGPTGGAPGCTREQLPEVSLGLTLPFWLIFTAFFVCYLSNGLAPEISPDGSSYHLGNVARDLRSHGFDWNYHSIYSSLSQGIEEMLYLVAFQYRAPFCGGAGPRDVSGNSPAPDVLLRPPFWLGRGGNFRRALIHVCLPGRGYYRDLGL